MSKGDDRNPDSPWPCMQPGQNFDCHLDEHRDLYHDKIHAALPYRLNRVAGRQGSEDRPAPANRQSPKGLAYDFVQHDDQSHLS